MWRDKKRTNVRFGEKGKTGKQERIKEINVREVKDGERVKKKRDEQIIINNEREQTKRI